MKAMVLYDREKPFRLEQRPEPRPGPGEAAIDSLATSGRAVVIGVGTGRASFDPFRLVRTEPIVTMEIMARGLVEPVIGMHVPLEDVETVFDALRNETLLGRGALTYP